MVEGRSVLNFFSDSFINRQVLKHKDKSSAILPLNHFADLFGQFLVLMFQR